MVSMIMTLNISRKMLIDKNNTLQVKKIIKSNRILIQFILKHFYQVTINFEENLSFNS